jgi:hypothetical protein
MEQKDYLLREIEKIGIVLRAILNKLRGNKNSTTIQLQKQFEEVKEMLSSQLEFNLTEYLSLNEADSKEYISQFKGINLENLELLANILTVFGMNATPIDRKAYLEKALLLFEHCNHTDKTFSFERQNNIETIKRVLESISG